MTEQNVVNQDEIEVETKEPVTKSPESKLIEVFKSSDNRERNSWAWVGDIYTANKQTLLVTPEKDEEEKKFKQRINRLFCDHLTATVGSKVPTHGLSRNGGKRMELRKKDAKSGKETIKWSTWQGAARTIQHLSEVGKLIFLTGDPTSIFDTKGKLKSRHTLREEIQSLLEASGEAGGETPYQTILRSLETASLKLAEIKEVEEAQAISSVAQKLYTDAMDMLHSITVKAA